MTVTDRNEWQQGPGIVGVDLLRPLFKHKTKILAIFVGTVAVVTLAVFMVTPVYEATASLLVKVGREFMPKTDVGAATNLTVVDDQAIINSEIAILKSLEVVEKVITTTGVDNIYPQIARHPPRGMTPLYAAVRKFAADLETEAIRKSNVIDVSFQHRDPVISAKALTLLIDFYKEKHLQAFSTPDSSFLKQQVDQFQRRLDEAEKALEAFKQKSGVYSHEEQRSLLLNQRVHLDTSLKTARSRISELQEEIASYQQRLHAVLQDKALYTQSDLDRVLVDIQTQLLSLQMKEQDLLAKGYRQDGRAVGDVRKGIRLVKSVLEDHEKDIRQKVRTSNPVYQDIQKELFKAQAELDSQQAGAATLVEQIVRLDHQLQSLDEKHNELRDLERAVVINETNYLTYVEKHEEARISDDLDRQKIANISVIQAPSIPQKHVKPQRRMAVVVAAFLGLVLGVGYAFFIEFMSQGLSTPEEVQRRLGLPVLTTIPLRQG